LRLNLGTGRQRKKLARLLSISDGFKVVAVRIGCDDHVKPKPSSFLASIKISKLRAIICLTGSNPTPGTKIFNVYAVIEARPKIAPFSLWGQ